MAQFQRTSHLSTTHGGAHRADTDRHCGSPKPDTAIGIRLRRESASVPKKDSNAQVATERRRPEGQGALTKGTGTYHTARTGDTEMRARSDAPGVLHRLHLPFQAWRKPQAPTQPQWQARGTYTGT